MNYENYFKEMFKYIPDYRKIEFLIFIIKSDNKLRQECGFLKSNINSLNKEFKIILTEQNEEYLSYIKNEEESLIERAFK